MSYLKTSVVISSIAIFLLALFSCTDTDPSLELECKRVNALHELEKGEIDPAIKYFLDLRDYYIEAAGEPFNRKQFIANAKARGEEPAEYVISGICAISNRIRSEFLEKAALALYDAGNLAYLRSSEEALEYYAQADELFSTAIFRDAIEKVKKELEKEN